MTSHFSKSDMATPGYFLFKPWSHTDKRHILNLVEGPFDKVKHLKQALRLRSDPKVQQCYLEPVDILDHSEVYRSDKKRIQHALKVGSDGLTAADLPFVGVSWTPRSPGWLKVESRRKVLRYGAYEFCLCEAMIRDDEPDRKYHIVTLLDPSTAKISP